LEFLAGLKSEDSWEDVVVVTVNTCSGAEVSLPDPATLNDVQPYWPAETAVPNTLHWAVRRASAHVESHAAAFVARLESRLQRDRKRLRDYYGALLKEARSERSNHETQQEQDAQKRAVELELRRKTFELEERYALHATLAPLTLVRVEMPALAIECEVFRKQARRIHTLYWNPVLTALEPLGCSVCGAGVFSIAFTDDVQPCCANCARSA
jgi:hypothetical protein